MTKKERQKLWETRLAEYKASGQSVTAWLSLCFLQSQTRQAEDSSMEI